ncbi:MAG: DUF4174 domain-containing protein [Bacteroidota bacterium]
MKPIQLLIFLLATTFIFAQVPDKEIPQIDKQKNEKRLLVLLANDDDNGFLKEQIDLVLSNKEILRENQISVIQMTNNGTKNIFNSDKKHRNMGRGYRNMRKSNRDFEVILVDFDGKVKMRKSRPVGTDQLLEFLEDSDRIQETRISRRNEFQERNRKNNSRR